MQGLLGKKVGMTRVFDEETGAITPVTVIEAGGNVVAQIKTIENDGYSAVQMGFGARREKNVKKPNLGHFKKHNCAPTRKLVEFQLDSPEESVAPGQKIGIENFDDVRFVDITGTVKGRGFSGGIKRWNMARGPMTHGSKSIRERGSHGPCTYPARVFPGLKMAGQYGNTRKTVRGIQIVATDKDKGLLYVKGAVPGANKGIVLIKKNVAKNL